MDCAFYLGEMGWDVLWMKGVFCDAPDWKKQEFMGEARVVEILF